MSQADLQAIPQVVDGIDRVANHQYSPIEPSLSRLNYLTRIPEPIQGRIGF